MTDPIVAGYDFVSLDDVSLTGAAPILRAWTAGDGSGRDADPSDPGDYVSAADNAGTTGNGWFQGCGAEPSSWHGTHVTGTIVAKQGNGIGISGVAPGVRVQPVRVLGRCGGYTSDIIDGIEWASGGTVAGAPVNLSPAKVISMSLGGQGSCPTATQTAIDDARSRGTVVVVAAGNSGMATMPNGITPGSQPADCAGVIDVVATDISGARPGWSNYGDVAGSTTISAPGVNILSTLNAGATTPGSATYGAYDGTSMATPHVAAAAALLQSTVVGRTAYTPGQVATTLAGLTTASPNCSSGCGVGILDLSVAMPIPAPLAPAQVLTRPGDGSVQLQVTRGDADHLPLTMSVEQSTDGTTFVPTSPPITAASSGIIDVSNLTNDTQYWFRVVVNNSGGTATPVVTSPVTPSAYSVIDLAASTLGVEGINVSWKPPAAPPSAVSGFAFRYRKVGDATWLTAEAPVGATRAVLSPWPTPLPGGTYEFEAASLHDGLAIDSPSLVWSTTLPAAVAALTESVTVSATTLRPYHDGYQDSVVIRASTNTPSQTTGTVQIQNSANKSVRTFALPAAQSAGGVSSWSVTWTGLTVGGARVAPGRYHVVVTVKRRGVLAAIPTQPSFLVSLSQASRPTITLGATSVYPVRDGFRDTLSIKSTATIPSVMTWRVVRARKVYYLSLIHI